MAMRLQARASLAAVCMALLAAGGMARADELPLVTGKQWTESPDSVKKAYLVGIANMVQVERAYHGSNVPTDAQSVLPRMAKTEQAVSKGVFEFPNGVKITVTAPALDMDSLVQIETTFLSATKSAHKDGIGIMNADAYQQTADIAQKYKVITKAPEKLTHDTGDAITGASGKKEAAE